MPFAHNEVEYTSAIALSSSASGQEIWPRATDNLTGPARSAGPVTTPHPQKDARSDLSSNRLSRRAIHHHPTAHATCPAPLFRSPKPAPAAPISPRIPRHLPAAWSTAPHHQINAASERAACHGRLSLRPITSRPNNTPPEREPPSHDKPQ